MFVNRIPFLTSIIRHIKFTTAETLHNLTTIQLLQCVTNVKALYKKRGFNVTKALMDGEFFPDEDRPAEYGRVAEHIVRIGTRT